MVRALHLVDKLDSPTSSVDNTILRLAAHHYWNFGLLGQQDRAAPVTQ